MPSIGDVAGELRARDVTDATELRAADHHVVDAAVDVEARAANGLSFDHV